MGPFLVAAALASCIFFCSSRCFCLKATSSWNWQHNLLFSLLQWLWYSGYYQNLGLTAVQCHLNFCHISSAKLWNPRRGEVQSHYSEIQPNLLFPFMFFVWKLLTQIKKGNLNMYLKVTVSHPWWQMSI